MYEIIFYHFQNGESEIEQYLEELKKKAETSKADRINRTKILSYLNALSQYIILSKRHRKRLLRS